MIVLQLVSVLLVARIIILVAERLRLPKIVGLLFAGILVGYEPVRNILIGDQTNVVLNLGNVGLLCLMFIAGMESSWTRIRKTKKEALIIALSAVLFPFILGFGVLRLLDFSFTASLIGATCMSITAEATTAKLLLEFRKLKTKLGTIMMATGIIDDLIGLLLFMIVSHFIAGLPIVENGLVIATIAAFFLGAIIQKYIGREHRHLQKLELVLNYTIIPFFFIAIGLQFDFEKLILSPLLLETIMITALLGKMLGTLLIKPFVSFNWKQLHLLSWAMNSRGAVELAFALIALNLNLISTELYSALVIMALCTTLIFPLVFMVTLRRHPKIMN